MQFLVPQFIDIEDKIIGPLTLKQFVYLAGAGGIILLLLLLFQNAVVIFIIAPPIVALALALAFLKVNDRSFLYYLISVLGFFTKPKRYIWKRLPKKKIKKGVKKVEEKPELQTPTLTKSKVKKLAWQLDIMKQR